MASGNKKPSQEMFLTAKKTAEMQDWSTIVIRTIWDVADLNASLAKAMAFEPDNFTCEQHIIDQLADTILSCYTMAYKMGTDKMAKSMDKKVQKRKETLGLDKEEIKF